MATDATGTPTTKGIPKYDPENDAPSGLGFNATMDAIDTLLGWAKIRKNSAGTVLSRGRINFIEGANVTLTVADDATDNEVDVTIASSSAAAVGYATTLPGSPTDGQESILVDSLTVPTYQWRFRWNNGSSNADKWEFIGGTPALIEVATSESTASTTYAALTTAGPSFALPKAGVYEVSIGAYFESVSNGSVNAMSYDIGGTAAVDADNVRGGEFDAENVSAARSMRKTGLTAVTLTAKYRVAAGTGTFAKRWMRVVPVRVS